MTLLRHGVRSGDPDNGDMVLALMLATVFLGVPLAMAQLMARASRCYMVPQVFLPEAEATVSITTRTRTIA
jgi:hypothetical protein